MNKTQTSKPSSIPHLGDLFIKPITRQTLSAWEPYFECVSVNFELQNSDIDKEHPEWRMHWVFGVAILRSVGHVLAKIDACRSMNHKHVIDTRWSRWKDDRQKNWIFWDFIECERNNILKAFEFGVEINEQGLWHTRLHEDGIHLVREATYWWRTQLEEIETEIEQHMSK